MLTYRRKPNSGKMHMMSRKGGSKQRAGSLKTFRPGDTLQVEKESDLPGFPDSMDGWELIQMDATVETGHEKPDRSTRKRTRTA